MGFFDDDDMNDPFQNIFREFFGSAEGPYRKGRKNYSEEIIEGEEEDRIIDFVESEDYVYLVFELPGYDEKDISVSVKGRDLEIKATKKNCDIEKIQNYLSQKLCRGIFIKKILPNALETKGFKHTVRNGILEVVFSKK